MIVIFYYGCSENWNGKLRKIENWLIIVLLTEVSYDIEVSSIDSCFSIDVAQNRRFWNRGLLLVNNGIIQERLGVRLKSGRQAAGRGTTRIFFRNYCYRHVYFPALKSQVKYPLAFTPAIPPPPLPPQPPPPTPMSVYKLKIPGSISK